MEVRAVRTIAQRGVGLVGTAHGVTIHSLLSNTELNSLVGGISSITVGDREARERVQKAQREKRGNGIVKKNILERAHQAPFTVLIEIVDRNYFRIFSNVDKAVDDLLSTNQCIVEERWIDEDGYYRAKFCDDNHR